MSRLPHFHVTFSPPPPPDAPGWKDPNWKPVWPKGCWAVYQIDGDEIAQRIKFDDEGKVTERHAWCGYVGMVATLAEVPAVIERAMKESAQ